MKIYCKIPAGIVFPGACNSGKEAGTNDFLTGLDDWKVKCMERLKHPEGWLNLAASPT